MSKRSPTSNSRRARTRGTGTTDLRARDREIGRRSKKRKDAPDFETLTAVAHVVTAMRQQGISLAHAINGTGLSRGVVVRVAGSGLRRAKNGRYVATATDRLPRRVRIPDQYGTREVVVRNSKDATRVAELWNAVHKFLATGDGGPLEQFRGEYVTDIHGQHIPLFIGRSTLKLLGRAGVLSFESIYARAR